MNKSSDKLILTTNKKTIKVNEKGDEITLDLDDMSIKEKLDKFGNIIDKFVSKIKNSKNNEEQYKYSLEMSKEVVALIDDEATVKTFYKEKDHIRLQPENDTMDPFIFDNVTILGKAIGLYRHL